MEHKIKELALYIVIVALAAIAIAEVVHDAYSTQYAVQVSVAASPTANLYPYNTTYFNITLRNGGSSISSIVLGLYVNGTSIKEYKISIPHGESTSIEANYTYTANGTYAFSAIADPGHLLNIANRKLASASIIVNVSQSASPNVYKSMPNSGIENTTSFTFSAPGLYSMSTLVSVYNISEFNSAFGPAYAVLPHIFSTLYVYVAYANGATAVYANGTSAYTLWLKGTISPSAINSLLVTFGFTHASFTLNGTGLSLWKLSKSTSMCVFYQQGWTKLATFDNASASNETCASISMHQYDPTESNVLAGALSLNNKMSAYQSKFAYANSTNTGSLIFYNTVSIGSMSLFQNRYGIFAGMIKHIAPAVNNTCYGLLYNQSNTSICSVYVVPRSGKALPSYGMINSTFATNHYTATLYSLTNQSLLIAAHASAVALMRSLGLNHSVEWVSIFKNTCAFANSSINCNVQSYNYSTGAASLSIKNTLNSTIALNSISCFMHGAAQLPVAVNKTISPGNSSIVSTGCKSISLPVISTGEGYTLEMNYTYRHTAKIATGILNITNYGFG